LTVGLLFPIVRSLRTDQSAILVVVPRPSDPNLPGRVLDAVTPLFYGRGVAAVGMAEVADAAGTGKNALYRSFPSKDDLVLAYLQRFAVRITSAREAALDGLPPGEALVELARHTAGLVTRRSYRGCPFRNYLRESHDTRGRPGRFALAQVRSLRDTVLELSTRLAEAEPDVNADRLAERVWLVLEGVFAAAPYPERVALADAGVALVADLVAAAAPGPAGPRTRAQAS
jgi:AcrR family transcriptional regulator